MVNVFQNVNRGSSELKYFKIQNERNCENLITLKAESRLLFRLEFLKNSAVICFYQQTRIIFVWRRYVKISLQEFLSKVVNVKGQLISKGHFVFFNTPKKRTKTFCPSRLGQKFEFSSSFFGRIGDTKKTFRN